MFSLFNKKETEYVDCFFCDMKPTKEQSFNFQYRAEGEEYTVVICPLCAGILNDIMNEREIDDNM